jgi:hypothetical protein
MQISIKPPAHTGKSIRTQQSPDLYIEQGAIVEWRLVLSLPADSVYLLFNEKEKLILQTSLSEKKKFHNKKAIIENGFYQVVINGKLSD